MFRKYIRNGASVNVKPTDRSISPQMSRKTSPSAMMMYGAESCVNRIGRLVPVTNDELDTAK